MRHAIWMEDDALAPGREKLPEAVKRILRIEWDRVREMTAEEDRGDAFVRRATIEFVQSFPGATGIYLIFEEE